MGGGEDGLLRIFHWPPVPPLGFPQQGGPVNTIVLSPDGKLFASGGGDQRVMLSEAASGKLLRTLEGQYSLYGQNIQIGPVEAVAFSRDSQLVVAGGTAGIMKLWNADGSDRFSLSGQTSAIHGVDVRPDGKQIASAGADGTIRLWELPVPPAAIAPPNQAIQAFALAADGKTAILAMGDRTVQVWPMPGQKADVPKPAGSVAEVKPLKIEQPVPPTAVAIAATGLRLASGDGNGQIRLADAKNGKLQATLGAHNNGPITALAFHPDSSLLLSAGQDGTLKLWDMTTPAPMRLADGKQPISAVAISADGKFAVSGGADGGIRQYACATGRPIRTLAEPGTAANPAGSPGAVPAITALALSGDDSLLAAAGDNGAVRLWATADGVQRPPLQGHFGRGPRLGLQPQGGPDCHGRRRWRAPRVEIAR